MLCFSKEYLWSVPIRFASTSSFPSAAVYVPDLHHAIRRSDTGIWIMSHEHTQGECGADQSGTVKLSKVQLTDP